MCNFVFDVKLIIASIMTYSSINSFLDCPLKNVLKDGTLDSLLAIRVCNPGSTLFEVLDVVIYRGIESYVNDNLQTDISQYIKSANNPDLPW